MNSSRRSIGNTSAGVCSSSLESLPILPTTPASPGRWIAARMVLPMLAFGVDEVTSLAYYHLFVSSHRPLGIAILILVFVQSAIRLVNPPPLWPPTMGRMERLAARASEYTMYALMFVLPLVGWGMLSAARSPLVLSC